MFAEPIHFWRAEYHSRHFQFEAFGPTHDVAAFALRLLLERHAAQYQAAPEWVGEVMAEVEADEMVRQLQFGAGYRDGELVCEIPA